MALDNIQKMKSFPACYIWKGSDLADVSGNPNSRMTFGSMPIDRSKNIDKNTGKRVAANVKKEQIVAIIVSNASTGAGNFLIEGVHWDYTIADGQIKSRADIRAAFAPSDADVVILLLMRN